MLQGRLNELMSQIRMQSQGGFGHDEPSYQMDANMQAEIKQVTSVLEIRQQKLSLHFVEAFDGQYPCQW